MIVALMVVVGLAAPAAVEVQGHRGARARFTENTLPAFRHALKAGVDVLELDTVVTRDGALVVLHDPVLPPGFCDGQNKALVVRSLTLAELQQMTCGASKDSKRFPKQRVVKRGPVPTLADVFALVQTSKLAGAKTVGFNIEAKTVPGEPSWAPPPAEFARLLVEAIDKAGLSDRAVVQSFDHRVLREVARLAPALKRSALIAESRPDLVAVANAAQAQIVSPHHLWITAEDVEACHAAGIRVIPWTLNRPKDWQRALDLGVDGIITDDPKALIDYLKAKKPTPRPRRR